MFEKADPGRLSETFGRSVERLNGRTDVLNGTRVDAYLQYSEVQKGLKQISSKKLFYTLDSNFLLSMLKLFFARQDSFNKNKILPSIGTNKNFLVLRCSNENWDFFMLNLNFHLQKNRKTIILSDKSI